MMGDCRYCGSGRVVPVLHARMLGQPHGGNPYRSRCLECSRWNPVISKDTFKNHLRPHVLEKDADPDAEGSTIPLEDWDESERYADVVERLENYADRDRPFELAGATDGGQEADDVDDQESDENRFECPTCGGENTGKPDDCQHCGATYQW